MPESEVGISLGDLLFKIHKMFRYLLGKWIVIIGMGLIGGVIGLAYALFKTPVYTAVTTFVLDEEKGSAGALGSLGGLASIAGIDLGSGGGGLFQGDNILELYKSRTMIAKTLLTQVEINGRKQLLIDRYIEVNKLRKLWSKDNSTKNIRFFSNSVQPNRTRDSLLGVIVKEINKDYLNVSKPDKKLNKIEAVVKSEDEIFARVFNEQIVETVNNFYVKTKTKKAEENVLLLQSKLDSIRSIVYGSINNAAAIYDATPNLNPTRQILRSGSQKSQVTIEANKAILSQLIQNLELAKITMQKDAPLIQIVDKPIYPLDVDKIGKAKAVLIGGIIFAFISALILVARLVIKSTLSKGQ